ncbi:hypothetical protein BHE74_00021669, partial [Ensete ventricosum]
SLFLFIINLSLQMDKIDEKPQLGIVHSQFEGWVFFLSLLGIIPLAERLGFATEYEA